MLTLCRRPTLMVCTLLLMSVAHTAAAQPRYGVRQEGDVVRLEDRTSQTSVSVAPEAGNVAFDMTVKGQKIVRWPYASLAEFKAKPGLNGIPFLGPWANRLDEDAFYANGRKYRFDMELGNVRGAIPIHGFLTGSRWQVVSLKADGHSARVTSRLDFYKNPLWMKQFPFAHTIDMTYTLRDGVLQVTTTIHNLSVEPMPVSIGFHPYFMLTDSRRDEWEVAIAAKTHWLLASNKVPTGETEPIEKLASTPSAIALKDADLDDVFGDLIRDAEGRSVMRVKGKAQQLEVVLGSHYRAVVVYAPKPTAAAPDRNFICIEPMAGITDAMNLAQKGLYKELQSIRPARAGKRASGCARAAFEPLVDRNGH